MAGHLCFTTCCSALLSSDKQGSLVIVSALLNMCSTSNNPISSMNDSRQ